jgi:hypothetical protein
MCLSCRRASELLVERIIDGGDVGFGGADFDKPTVAEVTGLVIASSEGQGRQDHLRPRAWWYLEVLPPGSLATALGATASIRLSRGPRRPANFNQMVEAQPTSNEQIVRDSNVATTTAPSNFHVQTIVRIFAPYLVNLYGLVDDKGCR